MAERQERAAEDAVLARAGQAVMLHHAGDREEARKRFLDLWAEIGEDGDPLHRVTVAHYIADTQDEPADELAWDLRALTAAESLTEERLGRAFSPSLHLNLAADYLKLAREDEARAHVRRAREALSLLGEAGLSGLREALERLEARLL